MNKTIKIVIIHFILIIPFINSIHVIYAQNLVPNPGFEDRHCCPDGININGCGGLDCFYINNIPCVNDWKQPEICNITTHVGTSDYYNTCDLNPNLIGPRSGDGYAGIYLYSSDDYREYLTIKLNSKLQTGLQYYVEFYVTGKTEGIGIDKIGAYFSKNRSCQTAQKYIDAQPQIQHSGDLIYSANEVGWVKVSGFFIALDEYEHITIGNFSNNTNTTKVGPYDGYYYVDDVTVLQDCCPEYKLFENTSNLPEITHAKNYVKAGKNVVSGNNISGVVTVDNGQNVTFKAGDYISLEDGFIVNLGATFIASIEECNDATRPYYNPITIISLGNYFTPNGDGVNDELCAITNGAEGYYFEAYNRDNKKVYNSSGAIYSNRFCFWDGKNNSGTQLCNDTYFCILFLRNCDISLNKNFYVEITGSSCKTSTKDSIIDESQDVDKMFQDSLYYIYYQFGVFPNPFHSITNITYTIMQPQPVTLTIKNILGEEVARLINNETQDAACYKKEFDATLLSAGIYFVSLQTGQTVQVHKLVKTE